MKELLKKDEEQSLETVKAVQRQANVMSVGLTISIVLLGIIAGTYSSIFIASQILVAWEDGDFERVWRALTPWRQRPMEAGA